MKFRIRSLMIEIVTISVLLAIWHLAPKTRFIVLSQILTGYAMNVPRGIISQRYPGPWSEKLLAGFIAYCAIILAGSLTIQLAFSGWSEVMATWPG